MPPGLLPTPFLHRLGECVPTYRLGLEGPAADQTPGCGNSRPTNIGNASLSRPKPTYQCGFATAQRILGALAFCHVDRRGDNLYELSGCREHGQDVCIDVFDRPIWQFE